MTDSAPISTGPSAALDPLIHPPHRLRICATLEPFDEYEFSALRDVVGVSDSVLSKQLAILMDARYVAQRRATRDGRQRVWLRLTGQGRAAFAGHVRALREIIRQLDSNPEESAPTPPSGDPDPGPLIRPAVSNGGPSFVGTDNG
jgi:DNA-binding MarR family transcriptional regulator